MNDTQKARENYEHFCYARDHGHLQFTRKAEKCDAYFAGAQWDPAIVASLERRGKPVLTVNKILSTCAAVFGEQLENRADISFRPSAGGNAETASALDKLWLHISQSQNLDWVESEVAADGFIRSRGFFDVRIRFDDQFRGEVRIKHENSKNVLIDPDADTYDPDEWKEVFLTKWLTLTDIELLYGKRYASELRARPHTAFVHAYDSVDWVPDSFGGMKQAWGAEFSEDEERRRIFRVIERQYRELRTVEFFADLETGDMRPVPERWDEERIRYVRNQLGLEVIRKPTQVVWWRVTVDDILLHDAQSPYRHFTVVPFFPFFRHGDTIGIVENLISPQDLLNKSLSQQLHIVNTTANSGWIFKSGSLANMTAEELQERGGEDGLIIETTTTPKDIEKIQPNQVPSGLDRLSYMADESLKEVSMVSDSMRGFDRADVAAKAIQAKQMRGTVSMAKAFDNLAMTRKLLARNVLDLFQSFYDEQRTIQITGKNLTDQSEELVINQLTPEGTIVNDLTLGEYAVVVSTVPSRQDFESSQFTEALEMRQLGIAIPDDVLVEHSHLNRKTEIAERIKLLNGGTEPTENEQRLAELEMQLKELETQEKQAEIQLKMTNAQLNQAKAQKEAAAETGSQAEMVKAAAEREKKLADVQIAREKLQAELQLKQEELKAEIQMQWEKIKAEIELKKAEAQMKMQVQQQQMQFDQQTQQQQMQFEQESAQQRLMNEQLMMRQKSSAAREDMNRKHELEQEKSKQQGELVKAKAKAVTSPKASAKAPE